MNSHQGSDHGGGFIHGEYRLVLGWFYHNGGAVFAGDAFFSYCDGKARDAVRIHVLVVEIGGTLTVAQLELQSVGVTLVHAPSLEEILGVELGMQHDADVVIPYHLLAKHFGKNAAHLPGVVE